ncbi:MAG TPA: hypothetical protein VK611_17050 [Acidimicrobiales bacterium]|nr:hypothetical protein [Acidimicrobiales bacterium]
MNPRARSPQLAALADHLADPYDADPPEGVRTRYGPQGAEFWDHMADLMEYRPKRPTAPVLDVPFEPELRPGERAGPSLVELAQARSPGTLHPYVGDTIDRQEAQRAERAERFPGWPWNEGGGVVHVYS